MTNDRTKLTPELNQVVLRLRDDLSIVPQTTGGQRLYVIEDRLTGKCYRLGSTEYAVASSLDGKKSLAEIVAEVPADLGDAECTPADPGQAALQVCKWLLQTGLAQIVDTPAHVPATRVLAPLWTRFNPIFIRVPLLSPDRLLERLLPWAGWLNSRLVACAAALLALIATTDLVTDWDRFTASAGGILAVEQGFYLLICWVVLKVAHELGHGLACKHHGGFVREAGVAFLLFAPIPYVDVTSSWRLRSKWARIHIAAAGMYVEAILGSIAVLIWSHTSDGVLNQLCVNIIVMATATTVLFNANPLMRFDGYYMLADWLEIPNLYSRGQQFTTFLFRRRVLGEHLAGSSLPSHATASRVVKAYGLVAWFWRITVCLSLICAASVLFHGAGIVLAVFAAISWFLAPAGKILARLLMRENWPQLRRLTVVTAAVAGGATLLFAFTPAPFPRRSPGVIEYKPITVVRSGSAGFVREILVSPGESVEAGDVIAKLENPILLDELRSVELAIKESDLRSRLRRQRGEMAAYQAEQDKLVALKAQFDAKAKQVDGLVVRAPATGQVVGRSLPLLLDSYLQEGDELCRVGKESEKEVQLSIHQDDVQAFQARIGSSVAIRGATGVIHADLTSITPRATDQPTHPALCSSHGGPLPVRADHNKNSPEGIRLLEPRFVGHVTLPADESEQLRAGQLCTISIRSPNDTIGHVLAGQVHDWFASKLR
ncbi:MAG: HlyD family efflux transporter periplasmic adaptor subunit [Planctomycetota bacterium]|nr:HlyD family efflux transporter periplasmic adaptor subunit [Planctomycetota bacterium]